MTKKNYNIEEEIGNLSDIAKTWGSLLTVYSSSYPFVEAHHTVINRLLNDGISDGGWALQLVYDSFANAREYGSLAGRMEDAIIVGKEKGIKVLKNCLNSPYKKVREQAKEILDKYHSGKFEPDECKSKALTGDIDEVSKKLEEIVQKRTRHWKD